MSTREDISNTISSSLDKLRDALDKGDHQCAERLAAVTMHLTQGLLNLSSAEAIQS